MTDAEYRRLLKILTLRACRALRVAASNGEGWILAESGKSPADYAAETLIRWGTNQLQFTGTPEALVAFLTKVMTNKIVSTLRKREGKTSRSGKTTVADELTEDASPQSKPEKRGIREQTRKRFTALHEIGHYLLHKDSDTDPGNRHQATTGFMIACGLPDQCVSSSRHPPRPWSAVQTAGALVVAIGRDDHAIAWQPKDCRDAVDDRWLQNAAVDVDHVRIGFPQKAHTSPGDLVVFDQRVDNPLFLQRGPVIDVCGWGGKGVPINLSVLDRRTVDEQPVPIKKEDRHARGLVVDLVFITVHKRVR